MLDAEYLTTKQVAALTNTSEGFWNNLRSTGGGPAYIKLAHAIRYRRADVDAWLADRARKSTFDASRPDLAAA